MLLITKPSQYGGGTLCEVGKETKTRYYVKVIDRCSAGSFSSSANVSGDYSTGNPYVERENVWKFGVTQQQYDAYKAAYSARARELSETAKEIRARWAGHIERIFTEEA